MFEFDRLKNFEFGGTYFFENFGEFIFPMDRFERL